MAFRNDGEIWEDRETDVDLGVIKERRSFLVHTDSKSASGKAVLDFLASVEGLELGAVHPSGESYLVKARAKCHPDDPCKWICTYEYSSLQPRGINPVDDPIHIEWDSDQFQEPFPAVNSAGDPFDPPPTRDQSRRTAIIKKNLFSVPSWILSYEDAINNAPFTLDGITIPKNWAKIQKIGVSNLQRRNGIYFRTVTIVMHFNKFTWKKRLLDCGYRRIHPNDPTKRIKIVNNDGTDPSNPVLLDGMGQPLSPPTVENAVFLEYDAYAEMDFSVLPLT